MVTLASPRLAQFHDPRQVCLLTFVFLVAFSSATLMRFPLQLHHWTPLRAS